VGADFDALSAPNELIPRRSSALSAVKVVITDFERTLVRLFEDCDIEQKFSAEVWINCFERGVPISVLEKAGESPYTLWMEAHRWMKAPRWKPVPWLKKKDPLHAEWLYHTVTSIATKYEMQAAPYTRLFDDVEPVLQCLHMAGIPVVIVSNNATAAVERVVKENGAEGFIQHVIGREFRHELVGNLKPKPNLLVKALMRSGHDPGTALLVGDSVDDMRAGRAAGIHLRVAVLEHSTASRSQLHRAGAVHLLRRFGDLPDLPELRHILHGGHALSDC
jgi:HAD superfamily hydrolase (TIGR01549 family)